MAKTSHPVIGSRTVQRGIFKTDFIKHNLKDIKEITGRGYNTLLNRFFIIHRRFRKLSARRKIRRPPHRGDLLSLVGMTGFEPAAPTSRT